MMDSGNGCEEKEKVDRFPRAAVTITANLVA